MHKYMIKRWICVENKKMRQQTETLVCDVLPFWSSRTVSTAPGHAARLNNWRKRSSACRGSSLVGLTVSCVDYLNRLSQSFFSEEKTSRRGLVALRFNHQRGVDKSDIISQLEAEHIQFLTGKLQPPSASNGRGGRLLFFLTLLTRHDDGSRALRATGPCRVHENLHCHLARC